MIHFKFLDIANHFRRDKRGNVVIIFAVCVFPLVSLIGAAVDYGRAIRARGAMQAAADAAALMISKDAANLNAAQISAKAQAYFNALFNKDNLAATVTAVYTPNTGQGATVKIDATSAMNTDFMRVAGYPTLNLNVSSTTKWGSSRLRIALALDNTGSMSSDGKMTALKTAVKNFIDKMEADSKTPGDIMISIVPFSKDVNVGPSNKNASWISYENYGRCRTDGGWDVTYFYPSKTSCQNASHNWNAYNKNDWQGCVTDRNQNYDVTSDLPTSDDATKYLAEYYTQCPESMMGMSNTWSTLRTKANEMTPVGNTNQPIGLAWAWQTLIANSPFPYPAEDANYQYQKVIIHMSDGLNTQNRWYSNQGQIDARQALLCSNIKATGITIYMIQVNTDGDPTQTVMQNCASSPDKFKMLTSGSQMIATFGEIGKQLTQLRISK